MLSVSIVICTDGRAQSLKQTLQSLRQLNYREFEVCVVYGPSLDGTSELLEGWPDPLKFASCPVRNLSVSRNIGIGLAAGDIIAFIDDDAIPEPEWLDQIVAAYSDDRVGAAGGFVHDHTGSGYQYRFGTTDRLGRADLSWTRAAPELNFPYSANLPHLLGANSSFRRDALLSVRGFDEEFDYYLDETDLAARIVDDGWRIVQIDGAFVHHKFKASALRNEKRILTSWYSVVKNKIYFGLIHRHGFHTVVDVINEATTFIDNFRRDMEWAINAGLLSADFRPRFESEIEQAWEDGLTRGFSGRRQYMRADVVDSKFLSFSWSYKLLRTQDRRTFCLLSQQYPPTMVGGVGRYVHQLARGLASLGHQVHVVTSGQGHNRVDLEDGVWVHRVLVQSFDLDDAKTKAGRIPPSIWDYARSMLIELESIASRRLIDCVYAPIWDCEGAAILRDGRFPLVVGLQTTLKFWLDSNSHRRDDQKFVKTFLRPMLALEVELLTRADALHAISHAIERDIERAYDVDIASRTSVIPLGLEDDFVGAARHAGTDDVDLRLLFVGRLESRKGIDVLLSIVPDILARFANVRIDIVGNDTIEHSTGSTYRRDFEDIQLADEARRRIVFHGEVSDEALKRWYQECDIFVAPSRFESFGLIFVEAMMFGKPVVGCRAGGMTEVIVEGETGLLAEPGDARSLFDCIATLVEDAKLRHRLGAAGRKRYESEFSVDRMATSIATFLDEVGTRHRLRASKILSGAQSRR